MLPVPALFAWLSYAFVINLIWPPELEVSREGVSWANFDTADANYSWEDIDGPEQNKIGRSALFVRFVALNHIGGATYDELAAVISSAREGRIISPEKWRIEHPQHRLRDWLLS